MNGADVFLSQKSKAVFFLFLMVTPLSILSNSALADGGYPVLSSPAPENKSYIGGGPKKFRVNVVDDNLDTNSVTLNVISLDAYDKGEGWTLYQMACSNSTPVDWYCEREIAFSIVGSDTTELFYFETKDNSGNFGYAGNSTNPFVFIIDRNPPSIKYVYPQENGSYVKGNSQLLITVSDSSSGVNSSTAMYSVNGSSWQTMTYEQPYYMAYWDTSSFKNNQTALIRTRAGDYVGNTVNSSLNVSIDNENPKIKVLQPNTTENVSGIIKLEIAVNETYSGLSTGSVNYRVGSVSRTMECYHNLDGYLCNEYLDTDMISDGMNTINFTAIDKAGNENSGYAQIGVDNTEIHASITSPKNGAYLSGEIEVNASVLNYDKTITGMKVKIVGEGYTLIKEMNCSTEFKCHTKWDTTKVKEGSYTITINVTNTIGKKVSNSISVIVDTTFPKINIDSPAVETLNGTFYPKVVVTDENGINPDSVEFQLENNVKKMNCLSNIGVKKYVCTSVFDPSSLSNGYYILYFYVKDLANNTNSTNKIVLISNPSGSQQGEKGTTTTTAINDIEIGQNLSSNEREEKEEGGENVSIKISNPIAIVLDGLQKTFNPLINVFEGVFEPFSVKALAISIVIVLIVFALFRMGKIKKLMQEDELEVEKE